MKTELFDWHGSQYAGRCYGGPLHDQMRAESSPYFRVMTTPRKIGVQRKWHQGDHYDVSLSKRAAAVALGAKEITWRECGLMTVLRRRDPAAPLVTPDEGALRIAARTLSGTAGD
jgi:hypothetical protein